MKILVVDDSSTIRRRIRKELEASEHEVFEAESGNVALEQLAIVEPHLITLDVDMPGLSGYEVCARIRGGKDAGGRFADIPIIFITANDTARSRQQGYQVGGNEFLSKPFLPGELSLAIDRARKTHDNIRGHTVLVVDDSKSIRTFLTIGLKAKGLKVIEAEDGEAALDILKKNARAIDIVVTDCVMPKMNGDELCAVIRRDLGLRDLPIIVQSSLDDKDSILKMFRAGASDFIVKPFSMEEMQARVAVHVNSKKLGDELRSNVTELKRAHKMKDKFLSICSHDLRAPLNGILGFTELMLMDEELNEENQEYLGHVQSSAEFLFSIVNDLLDLGRMESDDSGLEMEPVDVSNIIDSCLLNLKHMASPKRIGLSVEKEIEPGLAAEIEGNANALKRIFNNLISNSIKFSHQGSEVKVRLSRNETKGLQVAVIDSGIGIPEDKISGLFDQSTRTSQVGTEGEQSFGLGMVIVKKLIDQHRGEVSVQSQQGVGTTVSVGFPSSK